MLRRYTRLRKRLDKGLYSVECYIAPYCRELSVLLYSCTSCTDTIMRLACSGTSYNELLALISLTYHLLCNRRTCRMAFPRIQQKRAYILRICSLYRYTCIRGPAILHAYRSAVSCVGSLLTEISNSSCSSLHIIYRLSAGHCRGPVRHRRVALNIRHHSKIRDVSVHGILHHHVPYNELHQLYCIASGT